MRYCESKVHTKRWKTRIVQIGSVGVGGDNPIRIQSMTTSDTRDIDATVEQIILLADHGCEIVRVTVQGKKEAEACEGIKNKLIQRGYKIPLVADIHFYPPAAMLVADFVDKIRVNPGNYIDRRALFKQIDYNDTLYAEEIEKIEERFSPLVLKCKERGVALRIGANHGSLSDRIMSRYGDTPFGMVESAFEFARVCRAHDYHNFLFSMKASNPLIMIETYRLLVAEMIKLEWDYPLHLGVTEAGQGEDGRIKSALGIGSLLFDGLGDTIRLSLTEDPWYEIDPGKRLIELCESYARKIGPSSLREDLASLKRYSLGALNIEGTPLHPDGSVILPMIRGIEEDFALQIKFKKEPDRVDALLISSKEGIVTPLLEKLKEAGIASIVLSESVVIDADQPLTWHNLLESRPSWFFLKLTHVKVEEGRRFFQWMQGCGLEIPFILLAHYPDVSYEDLVIQASAELGALLADGIGRGIAIVADLPPEKRASLSFGILQAARMRSSKTEFIACPGCGRTLFDLQKVTLQIRAKTGHLPGVKIAVMGCIVNGPGEMADADFGYVGSKTNKIDLYVGKTCVEKNIDFSEADEKLIALIKAHGKWVEPQSLMPATC